MTPVWDALGEHAAAPVTDGNALALVENGRLFDVMETDIRGARSSINVVSYIWRGQHGPSERIGRAVLARAPGVTCRIVIDPWGSLKFSRSLEARLTASGCRILRYWLGPEKRLAARNHRKIVVVDGRVAITGGFGIWTSWEGDGRQPDEWRESNVRVRGPAVAQMQRAFEQSWREAGGDPLPRSDYPPPIRAGRFRAAFVASSPRQGAASNAEKMTHIVVGAARRRLWIANSYFIPDGRLQAVLVDKRRQGVDVRVLAPGPVHDVAPVRAAQRATYDTLIAGGVRIFEYQPSMMHSKTILVDDALVVIGSTNMDQLSFDVLEEGSLVAESRPLARLLALNLVADFAQSKEITREIWESRDFLPDVAREAASLFDDWL